MNQFSLFINKLNDLSITSFNSIKKEVVNLSPLQKKIVLVASAIFICCALFVSFCRYCFKAVNIKDNLDNKREDNNSNPISSSESEIPNTQENKTIPLADNLNGAKAQQNEESFKDFLDSPNPIILDESQIQTQSSDGAGNTQENKIKKPISTRLDNNLNDARTQQNGESSKGFLVSLNPFILDEWQIQTQSSERGGVGITSAKGRRPTMEDAEITGEGVLTVQGNEFPFKLFGVFDGHGGDQASKFVKNNIMTYLLKALNNKNQNKLTEDGIFLALKECFIELDNDFTFFNDVGTTATVALLIQDKIWVANVGDSRTILVDKDGQTLQATEDAKPNIPAYKKKIERFGGRVVKDFYGTYRVSSYLSVARAIGDKQMTGFNEDWSSSGKCIISPNPKITCLSLQEFKEGYLVLACDGLYDVASTNDVGAAIHNMAQLSKTESEMSESIVAQAINNRSGDNVTVVVVKL